jgi:hypothetical protein
VIQSFEDITSAVEQLPDAERKRFHRWYEEFSSNLWDQQIAEDSEAGRLDQLIEEAIGEDEAGQTTPL